MSKKPLPDNSSYGQNRRLFIRSLDPDESGQYFEDMLAAVPTPTEAVQADLRKLLDGPLPGRRRCGCARDQNIWLYGHMSTYTGCGRPGPWLAPFRLVRGLARDCWPREVARAIELVVAFAALAFLVVVLVLTVVGIHG